jgi:hypothetical protein
METAPVQHRPARGFGHSRNDQGNTVIVEGSFFIERPVFVLEELCPCQKAWQEGFGMMCMFCAGPGEVFDHASGDL